ncbi:uncharacterized protein LOC110880028 isoform X2 [Helianthus annuus]|uniref:uncharacterized protein LOC110880028 isoform X2 n=1 Tax=Helianthus annuus TaxID=4232 RepID=UPI000B903DA1|nr:uncharacterized protein LOC110880028 isoform X2 [Helianthus annuus]
MSGTTKSDQQLRLVAAAAQVTVANPPSMDLDLLVDPNLPLRSCLVAAVDYALMWIALCVDDGIARKVVEWTTRCQY